jgi:hypothetical protein
MDYTYEQLQKMTVAQMREIAHGIEHEAVKGASTMHKEKLLLALCEALGIESHAHHQVVGLDKAQIKAEIRKLKSQRTAALEKKDYATLKTLRRKIHDLKRTIRKATV